MYFKRFLWKTKYDDSLTPFQVSVANLGLPSDPVLFAWKISPSSSLLLPINTNSD